MRDSELIAFYRGDGRDHRGRSLSDIQQFDLHELELNHDYIQWLFPLPEPSGASVFAPLLSGDDIRRFRADESLRSRLRRSLDVMLRFFGLEWSRQSGAESPNVVTSTSFEERRQVWLHAGSHNFLRITRMLRSLSLLGCSRDAAAFLEGLERLYARMPDVIGDTTIGYWRRAVAIP